MPTTVAKQDQTNTHRHLGRGHGDDEMAIITPVNAPSSGAGIPYRQKATRLMLAALSMISIAIKTAIALRRSKTPISPMETRPRRSRETNSTEYHGSSRATHFEGEESGSDRDPFRPA